MPDPIDLSTYSADELWACVWAHRLWHRDFSSSVVGAGQDAGLVAYGQSRKSPGWAPTKLGDRVLVALRAKMEGLAPADVSSMKHATDGGHRNHYVADKSTPDNGLWARLVLVGVAERGRDINDGRDSVFRVSPIGLAALALHDREHQVKKDQ